MCGVVAWAADYGVSADLDPRVWDVRLRDGQNFVFAAYLRDLREGTTWIADKMERRLGMRSFIAGWHAEHKPWKARYQDDRTLKTFVLSE